MGNIHASAYDDDDGREARRSGRARATGPIRAGRDSRAHATDDAAASDTSLELLRESKEPVKLARAVLGPEGPLDQLMVYFLSMGSTVCGLTPLLNQSSPSWAIVGDPLNALIALGYPGKPATCDNGGVSRSENHACPVTPPIPVALLVPSCAPLVQPGHMPAPWMGGVCWGRLRTWGICDSSLRCCRLLLSRVVAHLWLWVTVPEDSPPEVTGSLMLSSRPRPVVRGAAAQVSRN